MTLSVTLNYSMNSHTSDALLLKLLIDRLPINSLVYNQAHMRGYFGAMLILGIQRLNNVITL